MSAEPELKVPSASELRTAQDSTRIKENQERVMKLMAECIFVLLGIEPDKQVTIRRDAVRFPITETSLTALKKILRTSGYEVDDTGDATIIGFPPRK